MPHRLRTLAAAVLAAAFLGGCAVAKMANPARTRVTGEITTGGPTLGPATFAPTECRSGDRAYFLGVDLTDATTHDSVRFLVDPLTGSVVRAVRQGRGVAFEKSKCATFRADLHPTGWRVNRVRDVSGSLEVACDFDQEEIRANVQFEHCH